MIAYIDLPLRGQSTVTGHEVLIVALYEAKTGGLFLVCIDEDGAMEQAHLSEVKVNWRFDNNRRLWLDVDTGEELDDGDGPD